MLYKNLSTRELYASIPDTGIITSFFETGLKFGSTQLAVSAMEELIIREDTDIIAAVLQSAADTGKLVPGTPMAGMVGRSLKESCRRDPLLQKYGVALLKGEGGKGPFKWAKSGEATKYFDHSGGYGGYVELRDNIEARYKAATAAYLTERSKRLKKILEATNLAPMERTAPEGVASIDDDWIEEALREIKQPQG